MRQIDLLIGGVIILAIVFSFVGVATYEAISPEATFDVTWTSRSQDVPPSQQNQVGNTGSQGRTFDYNIGLANLTKVDLTVRVQGAGPRANAVNIEVRVQPPANVTAPGPKQFTLPQGVGASGQNAEFAVPIRDLPNQTTAQGADENATLTKLHEDHRSSQGSGTWRITVVISGGTQVPMVGQTAEAYTITISAKGTTYSATVQPSTPEINR